MKLTEKAINKIDKKTRLKLAIALGFTEYWVGKLVLNNKVNGPLTTTLALQVIKEETGLTDAQILEAETSLVK